ncbi:MAG: tripartite tricarboxylate transporter substrate binding protein [Burkholderiales bacterium]
MTKIIRALCGTATMMCATAIYAQPAPANYPTKPIRFVVPFGPGGVGDITARTAAQKMGEAMGQQIIIDNRPSAGGVIAAEMVARAEPDGYTLMLLNNANAVSMAMFKSLPYDTLKDYAMVSTIAAFSLGVLVAPDFPVKTTKELITQARAGGAKFNGGTIQIGSAQYLAAELFKSMAGLNITNVPFNNTGAVIGALRGNDIQVAFEFLPPVLGQIRAGALRAIAVSSKKRFSLLPNVPTLDESGLPGYDVISWNGIGAPAKTPRAIVDRLNKELHAAVNSPQVKQRFQELGIEQNLNTPEGMRTFVTGEIAKWNALIDKARIPRL